MLIIRLDDGHLGNVKDGSKGGGGNSGVRNLVRMGGIGVSIRLDDGHRRDTEGAIMWGWKF